MGWHFQGLNPVYGVFIQFNSISFIFRHTCTLAMHNTEVQSKILDSWYDWFISNSPFNGLPGPELMIFLDIYLKQPNSYG